MSLNKLTILIPCYNEEGTLERIVHEVLAANTLDLEKEVIIIDDGSSDRSYEIAQDISKKNSNVKIIHSKKNLGKGSAIKKALPESTGDIILIQDADLEYSPKDFPRLIRPIVDKEADVVFGSRFIGGEMHRVLYFWHSLGNKILTFLSNVFTNLNLTDIETCYKLFRSKYIKEINLEESGFGFEPEIVAKVSKLYPPIKIFEVGVSYKGRTYHQGKKITWRDGVRAIYCIVKYNLFR